MDQMIPKTQAMFEAFKHVYGYQPPYNVIIDEDLYRWYRGNKPRRILQEDVKKFLGGDVELFITKCICEKLMEFYDGFGFPGELIPCSCKPPKSSVACLTNLLSSPSSYNKVIVGTTFLSDTEFIDGPVPVMSINASGQFDMTFSGATIECAKYLEEAFKACYDYRPPFSVLVDAEAYSVYVEKEKNRPVPLMEKYLGGKLKLFTTKCIRRTLLLESDGRPALELLSCPCDPPEDKVSCLKRVLGSEEFVNRKFIIASADAFGLWIDNISEAAAIPRLIMDDDCGDDSEGLYKLSFTDAVYSELADYIKG